MNLSYNIEAPKRVYKKPAEGSQKASVQICIDMRIHAHLHLSSPKRINTLQCLIPKVGTTKDTGFIDLTISTIAHTNTYTCPWAIRQPPPAALGPPTSANRLPACRRQPPTCQPAMGHQKILSKCGHQNIRVSPSRTTNKMMIPAKP